MNPIIFVGAGILLFGLGLGAGYWFALSQRTREAAKVSDIQQELDEYRRNVSTHFSDTAQHFQQIGEQYRSLYAHMVQGAEALCDSTQSDALLAFKSSDDSAEIPGDVKETDTPPEMIKDYAPPEEPETAQLQKKGAAPGTDETIAESSAPNKTADKPTTDDVAAEPVVSSTTTETERTVH